MTLGLKIKCSCYCSYTISNTLSLDKISCPNCGKIPSFSDKVVDLMKTASQLPVFLFHSFNSLPSCDIISLKQLRR